MEEKVRFSYQGKEYSFPVLTGSDGKQGIDIGELYNQTGLVSYDPGLYNTAIGISNISIKDPKEGDLSYRGFPVEELVKKSSFVETAWLLIYGDLPSRAQLQEFSQELSRNSMIHEDMVNLFDGFPGKAHPLAILSVMVTSLSTYDESDIRNLTTGIDTVTGLLGRIRTMAAFSYKKMIGQPFIYPQTKLPYCENFLNMLFATPASSYTHSPYHARILNQFWILYAEHEQNVSTAAVEIVGSTQANVFASIAAGITALWGTREGGRNVAAIELLEDIINTGGDYKKYFEKFKSEEKLLYPNGFGHRAYDVISPRARIARNLFLDFYKNNPIDKTAALAMEIDEYILNDPFFVEKKFYPNIEFYSGAIFNSIGIPKEMFSVMQAIGKLPGWIAHWKELQLNVRYVRPRQIYNGSLNRQYIPIDHRK